MYMFLCVLDYIRWSCVLCGQCYAFRLQECLLCAYALTDTFLCSIGTMKTDYSGSIVYYVRLWYCLCHRPYAVAALSIDLLACLQLCMGSMAFRISTLNFLKNALDENYFQLKLLLIDLLVFYIFSGVSSFILQDFSKPFFSNLNFLKMHWMKTISSQLELWLMDLL